MITSRSRVGLSLIVSLLALPACAFDYLVQAVPPKLEKDAATTLLVSLTEKKNAADFAAGEPALGEMAGTFVPGGGYRGAIAVTSAGNFSAEQWTVELILRLPEESAKETRLPLLGWQAEKNYGFDWNLNTGGGASFTVRGPRNADKRKYEFQASGNAGGNGFSVQRNAVGEWVYAAIGLDFAARRVGVILRDMQGNVLKKDMNFAGNAHLGTDFLKDIPEDQKAAAIEQCWAEMAVSFAKGVPQQLNIGNAAIEIRQLRISKTFRENVLIPAPAWDDGQPVAWTAGQLDPARAKVQTLTRLLGYRGYRNSRDYKVAEAAVELAAGSEPLTLKVPNLKIGIYTFYLHGSIDPRGREKLERVWKPCGMEFQAFDSKGQRVEIGRRLLKQSFDPRRMQGFHLHVSEPGDYTLKFQTLPTAQETPRIQRIVMFDHLGDLPDVAIKKEQVLARGQAAQLTELTEERRKRDDGIWAALPPINLHLQVHGQVKQFQTPPNAANLPKWETQVFSGVPSHRRPAAAFAPLDFVNTNTKEVFPHEKVIAGIPFTGERGDDGCGIYLTKQEFPDLAQDMYYTPRANALGERVYIFLGLLGTWDWSGHGLPAKYFEKGDPNVGHDAALALVRLAYDWPAVEMNLHEVRLCTHAPDFEFNTDWSGSRRTGKYFYDGWSGGTASDLITSYDQVFPYLKGNQAFADAVHRFIPWVKTPDDVVRFLDRWLVFAAVKDNSTRDTIRGLSEELAGQVLGVHPATLPLFDLTRQHSEIYPYTGKYQELYATALSRSGCYYIASFMCYAFGAARGLVEKAHIMAEAKKAGAAPKMDLTDVEKYRKVKKAGDFLIDMWVAGGFPFMVGDASGGPHCGRHAEQSLRGSRDASRYAVEIWGDKRHAWLLKNLHGDPSPEAAKLAEGIRSPILHNPSRVVPDYGAILELGVDETDVARKTAATLRLGTGQGHAHSDYLDLNLFGLGLPLAVDLACRNEGNNWSRPSAGWALLHNHAIAHADEEPGKAGGQAGEPWLWTFAPPLARASYTSPKAEVRLDRDVILMEIGDTGNCYAFDLQRLKGERLHTWCFHGCESNDLQLNVPMEDKTVRWIDRTLPGSHKVGKASASTLVATWTMTREAKEHKHEFSGGGVIKAPACEPTVLGKLYDAALPPVHVRATLLGCEGDKVLQGSPYSQSYAYAFPFLWAQREAKPEGSVFPAIYEWYRGDKPVIAKAEWLERGATNVVKVTLASGQEDTFRSTADSFVAVSRDVKGLRWAKLSGTASFQTEGLSLKANSAWFRTSITDINYAKRALSTKDPLPQNPSVSVGNADRRIWLDLQGQGTAFNWGDDLLVHEGEITELKLADENTIELQTSQKLFHEGAGNRKAAGFTVVNEDLTWHFRGGKVIRKPQGGALKPEVFSDANGDGFTNAKTYEIGLGDAIEVPADVTLRRSREVYEVKTNVALEGTIGGAVFKFEPAAEWQAVKGK